MIDRQTFHLSALHIMSSSLIYSLGPLDTGCFRTINQLFLIDRHWFSWSKDICLCGTLRMCDVSTRSISASIILMHVHTCSLLWTHHVVVPHASCVTEVLFGQSDNHTGIYLFLNKALCRKKPFVCESKSDLSLSFFNFRWRFLDIKLEWATLVVQPGIKVQPIYLTNAVYFTLRLSVHIIIPNTNCHFLLSLLSMWLWTYLPYCRIGQC